MDRRGLDHSARAKNLVRITDHLLRVPSRRLPPAPPQFHSPPRSAPAAPRQATHPDWGPIVYNYGRNEVQNYLLSHALFSPDKYPIHGLRVDAVPSILYLAYSRQPGEWVPNEF